MKRTIKLLLTVVLMSLIFTVNAHNNKVNDSYCDLSSDGILNTTFQDTEEYAYGDVNGDGNVDIADLNILINIMLGTDDADNYHGRALLVHSDFVDIADINELINVMLYGTHRGKRIIVVDNTSLSFSGEESSIYTQSITVRGDNLQGDVHAVVMGDDENFSISPNVLTMSTVILGAELVVTYAPKQAGTHTAMLLLTSEGADTVSVTLTGQAEQKGCRTFTVNGVTFKMIAVKGGTFTMGATSEQGSDAKPDEKPTHLVALSDYYIGETEVTQSLWQSVMGNNPSKNKKGDNYPVENVSWNDCQEFVKKLSEITGETFRLPTEAEWEYAARGGIKSLGYKYAGSNNAAEVAWYGIGTASKPVALKAPNELGLFDMSGNVEEWCYDWYGNYSSDNQTNPIGPSTGSIRVDRGGSYYSDSYDVRVSRRDAGVSPLGGVTIADPDLGLRLVMGELTLENVTICQRDGFTRLSDINSADYDTPKSKFRTVRLDLPLGTTNGNYVSVILRNMHTGSTNWRENRIQTLVKSMGYHIRDNSSIDKDITKVGQLVVGSNDLWEYTFSSEMEVFTVDGNAVKDMVWVKLSE